MADTIHVQPTAELAERVLLPGDPGRALRLAEGLLERPRMFNHHRGLWGYTGTAPDGGALTIQSTGMGGPSAAIVITELRMLGAERMVRVGTCGALVSELELGSLLIASEAIPEDGASRALSAASTLAADAPARLAPDPTLLAALTAASPDAAAIGAIVSTDLFYADAGGEQRWRDGGALAVEMEAATLFALGAKLGFSAAAILVVTDALGPERRRIDPEALLAAEQAMGAAALRAVS